jgi:hypothetical protein
LGRAPKRRRLKIRPSLAEPGVRETDIGRRAEMLADLAGDCLVACLRPGDGAGRNSEGGRKLWHGLKGGLSLHARTQQLSMVWPSDPWPR